MPPRTRSSAKKEKDKYVPVVHAREPVYTAEEGSLLTTKDVAFGTYTGLTHHDLAIKVAYDEGFYVIHTLDGTTVAADQSYMDMLNANDYEVKSNGDCDACDDCMHSDVDYVPSSSDTDDDDTDEESAGMHITFTTDPSSPRSPRRSVFRRDVPVVDSESDDDNEFIDDDARNEFRQAYADLSDSDVNDGNDDDDDGRTCGDMFVTTASMTMFFILIGGLKLYTEAIL